MCGKNFTRLEFKFDAVNFGRTKVFWSNLIGCRFEKRQFNGIWNDNDIVNQLKIRGGFGVTGNDNIGDFQYLSTISGGRNYTIGNPGSIVIGNSPNAPSNPDLKWEETSQLNIGFDTRLFNDISLSFDWYKKTTTDADLFVSIHCNAHMRLTSISR